MSLTLSAVSHAFGHDTVLADIDLAIGAGERVAIIGPSGAGKTTLLKLMATALQPQQGRVTLLGSDPWALRSSARQRLRARIGLIHQAAPLPPRQRVVTAVAAGRLGSWSLGRALLNLLHPLDIAGVEAALGRLDLADKLFDRCDQLSGGQLQRVGIARVLYQAPALLLADEPVASMDPVLADHTIALLNREAEARGIALVASLHSVELALAHFSRIIGLRAGQVVFDKPADRVSRDEIDALYLNEQLHSPPVIETIKVRVPLC